MPSCVPQEHTPWVRGGSHPGVGYSSTSGVAGVCDRAGLHRAGAPTPPTAGVCGQGGLHAQMRKVVCELHSLRGGYVCVHTNLCACGTSWDQLQKVIYKSVVACYHL